MFCSKIEIAEEIEYYFAPLCDFNKWPKHLVRKAINFVVSKPPKI